MRGGDDPIVCAERVDTGLGLEPKMTPQRRSAAQVLKWDKGSNIDVKYICLVTSAGGPKGEII